MIKIPKKYSRKLKWGVAGCGRFAEQTFLPTIKLLRKSVVTSLYSSNLNRAKSLADKFGIEKHFNNYDEFLKSDINAVYISSANSNHYQQVIAAAKAGKHILCEKPLAMTSLEAEEMVKTCEQNNVQLAVNYVYRFHPLIIKSKEMIANQMLGKIVSMNLNFNIDAPPGSNFRFTKSQSGGGALRDLGTHMIDLMRYFGGEIVSITGVLDNIIYKSEVEDFSCAIVKFENGGYGFFNVSFNNKKSFNRIEILGHKGAISLDNLIGGRLLPAKLTILLDGEAKKAFRRRGNRQFNLLKSVQNSFLNNQPLLVTGYDGLINMKIMEELESKCL
ncbi:MAG: dehydrogenase [Ignavibacteria bacterium RIFOXYB2_FULL_35_12]|nr:MAG: dehydrogenase [Ignavibacteria bacterium GWA2_36_19]OGU50736.1 MAG: dehydrogenase [Ignavibacteria bacterium GWC2_35_8]OGU61411.1 MAG: dehydrogenase [Ignavibacteria bacterium GWF2_35_20]OGU78856.1 MAG: dehydrogenase [Ignavibacteria bacterium RIFOXYA2_FULL_35_9]OGU85444.1 MAG: dehydrogenase [Ignavibacteria bacterium RIFOXYA12_FULL_35_25]OGU90212.1 MAG: dehydrogenase [Ignavibacteria bacterium RIFOXYC12_FULL_35_11]OGU96648.1 MAG: dehydrogenase [Ignavibacteria bacterium RIFOXYB12_FULL_35_14